MPNTNPIDCPYYLIYRATLAATGFLKQALAEAEVDPVRPAYLGVLMSLWQQNG